MKMIRRFLINGLPALRLAFNILRRKPKKFIIFSGIGSLGFMAQVAYGFRSYSLSLAPAVFSDPTEMPEVEIRQREKFLSFASLEFRGEAYMTPRDFVKCFLSPVELDVPFHRVNIDEEGAEELIRNTPKLNSNEMNFKLLNNNGLISFTEYMFLVSVLTHPPRGLELAFRMFDRDLDGGVDIHEFKKITKLFAKFCVGDHQAQDTDEGTAKTTLLRHFFGKHGTNKLNFRDFYRFISNLQSELLLFEFNLYTLNQSTMSPSDLARSLLRFTCVGSDFVKKGLRRVNSNPKFIEQNINFEDYKSLYDFLYVLDDFASAIRMFSIARHSISRDEFQRAARAVIGKSLNSVVLDTIFTIFDADGDGHLSSEEFIQTIRARGLHGSYLNPSLRFAYWPRYVARLLRFRPVYRKELLGWRFETEHSFLRPDSKPNEIREEKFLPVWHFSENPPWNIANRLSEFPYPDVRWCVLHPDGSKEEKRLDPISPDEQLVFKGDRVRVLVGPDKGKVGIVSSVLKMRHMVYVDGLNYKIVPTNRHTNVLKRDEIPLDIDTEISLIDPVNNESCKCTWRYTESGARVRVSMRTGHIIPLPAASNQLDDTTDPKNSPAGLKDTPETVVLRTTFDPSNPKTIVSFEKDISTNLGFKDELQDRLPTYWY